MRIGPTASPSPTLPSELPKVTAARHDSGAQPASTAEGPSAFAKLLHGLGHELKSGENMFRAAEASLQRGSELGPAELIALQMGVYRYSDAVDLASRLVDRATGALKTVIQGSGQ